jgi:hypothetical protein
MADNDFDEILRIQRMLNDSARRELQDDRLTSLMALVNSLIPEKKTVQIEQIFYVAETKGYSEDEIKSVIIGYIKDKMLFQPEVGYIRRR